MARYAAALALAFSLSGCLLFTPFHDRVSPGSRVEAGKVLVIGKVQVRPPITQGGIAVHAVHGSHEGVIKLYFDATAKEPLDKSAAFPFSPTESADASLTDTSFIAMPVGKRYLRLGTVMVEAHMTGYVSQGGSAPTPTNVDAKMVGLYGDLEVDIPAGAKAVYIGTLVYDHTFPKCTETPTGICPSTHVTVLDEMGEAMKALGASGIKGVSAKDVKKKLARVIRQ